MWSEGRIANPKTNEIFKYWVKHYEEPSEDYGIDGGRISKLTIRRLGEDRDLVNYDRGWDKEPTGETKAVYELLLAKYN